LTIYDKEQVILITIKENQIFLQNLGQMILKFKPAFLNEKHTCIIKSHSMAKFNGCYKSHRLLRKVSGCYGNHWSMVTMKVTGCCGKSMVGLDVPGSQECQW
jgi:hypothetical protein